MRAIVAVPEELGEGPTIDNVLKELVPYLDKGDVVIDELLLKDFIRREIEISKQGIHFVDSGISGGIERARYGACFMVRGKPESVKICEPILKALAVKGGYLHTGVPESGHFIKLVHNGIEFGMLQAIGEGVELLCRSDFNFVHIYIKWKSQEGIFSSGRW